MDNSADTFDLEVEDYDEIEYGTKGDACACCHGLILPASTTA